MRGRSETLEIGPWIGGLNVRSDPYIIGDEELAECQNVFVDVDGSLCARPVIVPSASQPAGIDQIHIIGNFRYSTGYNFLVVATNLGLYIVSVSTVSETWILIRANLNGETPSSGRYYSTAIYRDVLYVSGSQTVDRLRIDISNPLTGFTFEVDNTIPPSNKMVVFKARLFAKDFTNTANTNNSRLFYSNVITDVATWEMSGAAWTDFLDINPATGDDIVELAHYNDDLLILKENSSYVLVYDDLIANAFVRQISSTIGAVKHFTSYSNSVLNYQNTIYVLTSDKLYELSGYNFIELNVKMPFRSASAIGLIEDHIYVATGGQENYVYSLLTKTWSRWVSEWRPLSWVTMRPGGILVAYSYQYANYPTAKPAGLIKLTFSNLAAYAQWEEPFEIKFRTKIFNFGDNSHFKKLKYWFLATLSPTSLGPGWPSTPSLTLKANIYDATFPAVDGGYIQSDSFAPVAAVRTIIKALKTLRFKAISFEVVQNGAFRNWNRPRFYGITALVSQKQTVDRKGN